MGTKQVLITTVLKAQIRMLDEVKGILMHSNTWMITIALREHQSNWHAQNNRNFSYKTDFVYCSLCSLRFGFSRCQVYDLVYCWITWSKILQCCFNLFSIYIVQKFNKLNDIFANAFNTSLSVLVGMVLGPVWSSTWWKTTIPGCHFDMYVFICYLVILYAYFFLSVNIVCISTNVFQHWLKFTLVSLSV